MIPQTLNHTWTLNNRITDLFKDLMQEIITKNPKRVGPGKTLNPKPQTPNPKPQALQPARHPSDFGLSAYLGMHIFWKDARAQRTQYPLIKEYTLGFLKGFFKGIYKGLIKE